MVPILTFSGGNYGQLGQETFGTTLQPSKTPHGQRPHCVRSTSKGWQMSFLSNWADVLHVVRLRRQWHSHIQGEIVARSRCKTWGSVLLNGTLWPMVNVPMGSATSGNPGRQQPIPLATTVWTPLRQITRIPRRSSGWVASCCPSSFHAFDTSTVPVLLLHRLGFPSSHQTHMRRLFGRTLHTVVVVLVCSVCWVVVPVVLLVRRGRCLSCIHPTLRWDWCFVWWLEDSAFEPEACSRHCPCTPHISFPSPFLPASFIFRTVDRFFFVTSVRLSDFV